MIAGVGTWLAGVTAVAILIAVADSLMPGGTVKKISRLTAGLVFLAAVLRPLGGIDQADMARVLSEYRNDLGGYAPEEVNLKNIQVMKIIIADKTGAYIVDKAAAMGVSCTAEVICAAGEGEIPYPTGVAIQGDFTAAQQAELTRRIETDLAIPAAEQHYESGERE
ncbi:MAG: stage III sporulation protein AF [Clostridiales bacterium]|nr:stage III sporulation protein AF [Clostridiales bacterium]